MTCPARLIIDVVFDTPAASHFLDCDLTCDQSAGHGSDHAVTVTSADRVPIHITWSDPANGTIW